MGGFLDGVMNAAGAKSEAAPTSDFQIMPDEQRQRDQDSLRIFDDEIAGETDPSQRAALQRQRDRIAQRVGVPSTPQQNTQADAPSPPDGFSLQSVLNGAALADGGTTLTGHSMPSTGTRNTAIDSIPVPDSPEWNALPDGSSNVNGPSELSKDNALGNVTGALFETPLSLISSAVLSPFAAAYGLTGGSNVKEQNSRIDKVMEHAYHPVTHTGGYLVNKIGSAIDDSGIIGVAPMAEFSTLGQSAGPATAYAKNGAAAEIKQMFADRGGAPVVNRIEPTLPGAKPRIKLNSDGSVVQINTEAPDVREVPPVPYQKPTVENSSQQVKKYVADNPDMTDAEVARHVEADSLPIPARLTQGQGSQDVHQISFEQNNKGKNQELGTLMNQQNQNLIDNMNAIREKVTPDVNVSNPVEAGQALVDSYKKMDNTLKTDISDKYQALKDANGGQFPLDAKAFVDNADQALHQGLLYDHVPASIRSTLDRLKDGGQMTFENFESLRTNLARLQRSPTLDGNAQAAAGVIRNALEDVPIPPGAENLKPLADQARAAARARFQLIESDPAYSAISKDDAALGEPSPLSDKFIENYVINGKRSNVQNMVKNLSSDPQAKQVIAAGVLDHLKTKSGVDLYTNAGNVSQAGYNRALSNIRSKIDLVFDPETAQNVQKVGNVARYQQFQPRGSYVNNSNTLTGAAAELAKSGAEVGTNMAFGGVPVGSAIRKASQYVGKSKQVQKSLGPAGLTKLSEFP